MGCMARQLTLLELPPSWRLDDATRAAGRRGVAEARATLQAALAARQSAEAAQDRREHPSHRRSAA
jgi:hypothetical protein